MNRRLRLFFTIKLVLIAMILLISACAQQQDSIQSNNNSVISEEPEVLTVANPGDCFSFNGSRTSTFLVLDNFTNKTITNIQYQVDDSNHIDPLNSIHVQLWLITHVLLYYHIHHAELTILVRCLVPESLMQQQIQLLVKYQINGQTKTTSAVINYRVVYSDSSSNPSNLLSMGSPNAMTGTNGTRSAMLYYYMNGKTPVALKDAGFNTSSFNIINKNFTNDSSIAFGTKYPHKLQP